MVNTDRSEFEVQLATLCAGFNVPLGDRTEAYWRGLAKMELRTFVRVVEHCLGEDGPEKIPTTKQCWSLSKTLRRFQAPAEPLAPPWKGDHWDILANEYLRAHLRNDPQKYAPDSTYDAITHQAVAGPMTKRYTEILVRWKKTWAEDMRAEAKPTTAIKLAAWTDCMERADEQIRLLGVKAA